MTIHWRPVSLPQVVPRALGRYLRLLRRQDHLVREIHYYQIQSQRYPGHQFDEIVCCRYASVSVSYSPSLCGWSLCSVHEACAPIYDCALIIFTHSHTLSLSLARTHPLFLARMCIPTHSLSLCFTCTLCRAHTLAHSLTLTLSPSFTHPFCTHSFPFLSVPYLCPCRCVPALEYYTDQLVDIRMQIHKLRVQVDPDSGGNLIMELRTLTHNRERKRICVCQFERICPLVLVRTGGEVGALQSFTNANSQLVSSCLISHLLLQ